MGMDRRGTGQRYRAGAVALDLRLVEMATLLDHWQQAECAQQRRLPDDADVKVAVMRVGAGIDVESAAVRRADADRGHRIQLALVRLPIYGNGQLGAAIVMEEE